MVIAIISDTHMPRGSRTLPDPCVSRLRGADLIVHAGDFTGESVLDSLEALGPPVAAVHGNADVPALRERLPSERVVNAEGAMLALIHDAGPAKGRFERLRRRFQGADAVVFGHSHLPLHEEREGFAIFNPGSPTERRRASAHTMGLARMEHGCVRFEVVALLR